MDLLRGIKETRIKAFKGWPKAVIIADLANNAEGIRIEPVYLTPLGARLADLTAKLGTIFLVGYSAYITAHLPAPRWEVPVAMILAFFPLKYLLRYSFRSFVRVDVLEDRISVKRALRTRRFPRDEQQQFAVIEPHDRAAIERARHEVAARRDQIKGKARFRTRYYQDAAHVVMRLGGERFDIANVFDASKARRMAERLIPTHESPDSRRGIPSWP